MQKTTNAMKYLRSELGVTSKGSVEPAWEKVLAAIRDIPEILTKIQFDMKLQREGYRPQENAVSCHSLIKALETRKHGHREAAYAIFRLVEVGCLEPRAEEITATAGEARINEVSSRLRAAKIIESPLPHISEIGVVMCGVIATAHLAEWTSLVKYPGITEATSEMADDSWPPGDGWFFRPGECAYNGRAFSIKCKLRDLLARFVNARGAALSLAVLRDDVWKEYKQVDDSTIRGYISDLRTLLKKALALPEGANPIRRIDRQWYQLDLAYSVPDENKT